ncbi:hypothetical protein K9M74_03380 [Candidatus Woesearchaeota archaeon]|nr:hypothetical protein [Candidatus Woesearchaeota archaeon]
MGIKLPAKIPGETTEGNAFITWEFVVKETFSLELLYKRLHEFMEHEGWKDLQRGGGDYETLFSEQTLDNGALNHDIWWRAYKEPKNDFGGTLMYYLKWDMKTLVMGEKEFMHEGKKIKLNNGEFKVNAAFYMHFSHDDDNPQNVWNKHWLLKLAKRWFWKKVQERAVDEAEEELTQCSVDLYELMQIYTTMKKSDAPQDFVPVRGTHF